MSSFEEITINRRVKSTSINFTTDNDCDVAVKLLIEYNAEGKVNACKIETFDYLNKWFKIENIREWKIKMRLIDEALETVLDLHKNDVVLTSLDLTTSIHTRNQV